MKRISPLMSELEARTILGLSGAYTSRELDLARARAMRLVHPDHGGDGNFARVRSAYATLARKLQNS